MSDSIGGIVRESVTSGTIKTESQVNDAQQLRNSSLGQDIEERITLNNLENEIKDPLEVKARAQASSSGSKGWSIAFKVLSAISLVAGIAAGAAAIIATCGVAGIVGAAAATVTGLLGTTATAVAGGAGVLVGAGALAAGKGLEPKHTDEFLNDGRTMINQEGAAIDEDRASMQNIVEEQNMIIEEDNNEEQNEIKEQKDLIRDLFNIEPNRLAIIIDDSDNHDGYSKFAILGPDKSWQPKKVIKSLTGGNFNFPQEINSERLKDILGLLDKYDKGELDADEGLDQIRVDMAIFVDDILKSANVTTEDNPAVLISLVQMGISSYFEKHDPNNNDEAVGGLNGTRILSDEGRELMIGSVEKMIKSDEKSIEEYVDQIKVLESNGDLSEDDIKDINEYKQAVFYSHKEIQLLGILRDALKMKISDIVVTHNNYLKEHPAA